MRSQAHFKAYLALAAVCFFWGTTYLGIRMALESLPPLMLVSLRYLISGSTLLSVAFFSKAHLPTGKELWYTALIGVILIGIGNGCLAFAELWIPSGLAALFITTTPFWMIGVEAVVPGGDRLHGPTIFGMLVGLIGTLLLVAPNAIQHGFSGPVLKGFLLLQLGCCGWSAGSIAQRRYETKAHPLVSGAVHQLSTGLVFLAPALLSKTRPIEWTFRSAAALAWLVVFGAVIGYSAYIYVLKKLPISVVSVYSYVTPVVALFLGWMFYREPIGIREVVAMLIIFAGVMLVKRYGHQTTVTPQPAATPLPAPLDAG